MDRIIYSPIDQHCYIRIYDMLKKTHSNLGYSGYYVSMAINREKGIIYFGDTRSSGSDLAFYDLKTNSIIRKEEFYYGKTIVTFDGNFVHYENATFDGLTGLRISNTNQARMNKNISGYSVINTIFDNKELSVFTAMKDGDLVTVVYDLSLNHIVYTYQGKASNATKVNNTLVICNNTGDNIRILSLD